MVKRFDAVIELNASNNWKIYKRQPRVANRPEIVLMETMPPKISVIIPTYNRAQTLLRALQSVAQQSLQAYEVIVVDDGSTDETKCLLKDWAQNPDHLYLKTEQGGVSRARNLAAQKAQGDWFAFLDSDDEWLPEKLQRQVDGMAGAPLVHCDEIWIRNGVRVNPMKKHQKAGGDLFLASLALCCISPSAALISRSCFERFKGFREDFVVCEDYDLWLKITARYAVDYVDHPLVRKYGGHEDQLSRRYFAMDYWRVRSIFDLLKQSDWPQPYRPLAAAALLQKAEILLRGYRKHQNLENYDEIFNCLRMVQGTSFQ